MRLLRELPRPPALGASDSSSPKQPFRSDLDQSHSESSGPQHPPPPPLHTPRLPRGVGPRRDVPPPPQVKFPHPQGASWNVPPVSEHNPGVYAPFPYNASADPCSYPMVLSPEDVGCSAPDDAPSLASPSPSGNASATVLIFAVLGVVGVVFLSMLVLLCMALRMRHPSRSGTPQTSSSSSTALTRQQQHIRESPAQTTADETAPGLSVALIKTLPAVVFSSDPEAMRAAYEGAQRLAAAAGLCPQAGNPGTTEGRKISTSDETAGAEEENPSLRRSGSLSASTLLPDAMPEMPPNAGECAVCLGTYIDGDVIKWLPRCLHTFHSGCINVWLSSKNSCPLCRTAVGPTSQKPPS